VFSFIAFVITIAATAVGYWQARQFTQSKLRYVDAVHRMSVPILAGIGAAIVAAPIVWLLPIVGGGTALLFGAGVATGVAAGARDIRKRLGAG
jgi:membrane glycosyltransferase